ncbi:MAG: hypothetical protein ABR529_14165 [Actinomycetota bacterium]
MNRRSIIGGLVALLLLTGIIGANLVIAGQHSSRPATAEDTADKDDLECPKQGLPDCAGQMNDDKNEGPDNEANGADEANEGSENEANEADENDKHEDAKGAEHECPPNCDEANGEKP